MELPLLPAKKAQTQTDFRLACRKHLNSSHGANDPMGSTGSRALLTAGFGIDNLGDKAMLVVVAIKPQISKFGSSCPHRSPIGL
jgi:hypothetical protein